MQRENCDLGRVLQNWPYVPGEVSVRLVRTARGREVLQMRVDLGILQIEIDGRPDGTRPHGAETYFDYLVEQKLTHGRGFRLNEDQAAEVEREFMQFYYRRTCWLALNDYERAVRDADHNLALLDFVADCAPDEEWLLEHEQYRPFILFQRTQAAALNELEQGNSEGAIEQFNRGIERLRTCLRQYRSQEAPLGDLDDDLTAADREEDEIIVRLIEIREALREQYDIGLTLEERLRDAVEQEEYELAARLRDQIARQRKQRTSTSGSS